MIENDQMPDQERDFWAESDGADRRRPDPFVGRLAMLVVVGVVAVLLAWTVRAVASDGSPTPTEPPATLVPVTTSTAPAAAAAPAVIAAPADVTTTTAAATPEAAPIRATHATTLPAVKPASAATVVQQVVPARAAACTGATYTVRAGDGWIAIAKRVKVTTRQLLAANRATARTKMHPGSTICLPANAVVPSTEAAPARTVTTVPAPPSTVPVTTQVQQTRSYTQAEAEAIIRAVWPDDLEDKAVAIAKRESNLRPTAKNWCCSGLFQIYYGSHSRWLAGIGVTSAGQLLDPLVNANAAYQLYLRAGGWGPWGG